MNQPLEIDGSVIQGHGVASGQSAGSPYPGGTIAMQLPYFRQRGLDLSGFHRGTLNISIAPATFAITQADFVFHQLGWAQGFPSEDFSFVHCALKYHAMWHQGYIYYPHPETKPMHFQSKSTLEVITAKIDDIAYGDAVILKFDSNKVRVI